MDIALKVRSAIRNGQMKEALQLLSAVIDEKTMHICRVCERRSTNAIVILIASSTTMTAMTRSSSNQWFNTLDGQRTAWYNTEECWIFSAQSCCFDALIDVHSIESDWNWFSCATNAATNLERIWTIILFSIAPQLSNETF